ncbi:MAG TPA: glycosyltransferase, partial [Chloroflexota bacterium]|nr:glycosyltransferase [Chloroflexota bacterium]
MRDQQVARVEAPVSKETVASGLPKITVGITSYNYGRFIGEAIESVLSQDGVNLELIVVDDQSTDESERVIRSFTDPRLRFFRNETKLGVPAYNRCIALARGDVVAFLDADDRMRPWNLREKARLLDRHPEVGIVYSACQNIDINGNPIALDCRFEQSYIAEPRVELERFMFDNHIPTCSAVVVRKQCFAELGSFDETLRASGDYEMWGRIAAHYHVAFLAEPLIDRRRHNCGQTGRAAADGRAEAETIRTVEGIFSHLPPDLADLASRRPRALAHSLLRFAGCYLALGDIERGQDTLSRALREAPEIAREPEAVLGVLLGPSITPWIRDRLAYVDAVFASLPPEATHLRSFARKAKATVHMERVFVAESSADRADLARNLWQGLRLDPSWLRNRGVQSLMLETLIGRRP